MINTPQNLAAQFGNQSILLTWAAVPGATSYTVYRSTDGLTFTSLDTAAINAQPSYLDATATNGTQYYYTVSATDGVGEGPQSNSVSEVAVPPGQLTLGQLRLQAQQRADRVNSDFVTDQEWNKYIDMSLYELYDMLIAAFGNEYFVAQPFQFITNGTSQQYPLPDGTSAYQLPNSAGTAPAFYKLLGVDAGVQSAPQNNAWLTLKKFNFNARNRYVFPQIGSTFLGIVSLQYRILGNNIMFIPAPAGSQSIQLWYIPRLTPLLRDTDIADGVHGWLEYVIVAAAIKALQKEESDVSVLAAELQMLQGRIQTMAENRDAGEPETVGDSRRWSDAAGAWGVIGGDGNYGGY